MTDFLTGPLTDEMCADLVRRYWVIKAKAEAEAAEAAKRLATFQLLPHRMYPVLLYHDGLRWVCSYGVSNTHYADYLPDNAFGQSGVEAYGNTPQEATVNFDTQWVGLHNEGETDDPDDSGRDQDEEL
ncbi:MAG: hypothetical protein AMS22_06105 [Thiotrichales bacterium SG8_50]|nr:MAG: hypothetical protein AMS22_06105 [Thiotrichales bacterium SG8_50]